MKLKLAYYVMSRAKHLFRPDTREYDLAGELIRHRAWRAAERCAELGRKTDVQLHKSLKEFLAFFCVIALNELAIKSGQRQDDQLRASYARLIQAVCEGPERDPALLPRQLAASRIMTYKKSGFDHWFYGYWNADQAGMRVTAKDLADLAARGLQLPTSNPSSEAGLILLIRLAKLENRHETLPSMPALQEYDRVIREEVAEFVRALKAVLRRKTWLDF